MGRNLNILVLDTATPWLYLEQFVYNTKSEKIITSSYDVSINKIFDKVNREKDNWLASIFHDFTKNLPQADIIFIGEGPGSFTSLRISFSFFKTLAMLKKIPIYTFSSIDFYEEVITQKYQNKNEEPYLLIRANKNLFYGKNIFNNQSNDKVLAQDFDGWINHFQQNETIFQNKKLYIWNSSWMSRKNKTGSDENTLIWSEQTTIIDEPTIHDNSNLYFLKHPNLLSNDTLSWKTIFPQYGHDINYAPRKQTNYWKES